MVIFSLKQFYFDLRTYALCMLVSEKTAFWGSKNDCKLKDLRPNFIITTGLRTKTFWE